jgi:CBS-domain-containing membrane protein
MPNWISLTTVWFLQNLDQDYITPQALSSLLGGTMVNLVATQMLAIALSTGLAMWAPSLM